MRVKERLSRLMLMALMLGFPIAIYAQAPQSFSYQAVVRNGTGSPIASQLIGLRITLENELHVAYYTETHTPTSNAQGVISVNIGGGTPVGNGLFSSIPWKNGDIYIKLEIDPAGGSNYTAMGTRTQLQSVPYALYAENTKEVQSSPNANADEPIFVVKNKDGQIVFAVYQTGVRVYVEDSQIKGARGGFAIGGLTNQAKGQQEYFRITPDSARIFVKEAPTAKGARGGFAIGGLTNQGKAITTRNMMFVAPDSARIWVKESVNKGARGGFAIGGLTNQGKSSSSHFLNLTPENSFIGQDAGKSITTGLYNSFFGYQAGRSNTAGRNNIFIGYQSGYSNIGDALGTTGHLNIFVGNQSGYYNTNGLGNIFLGEKSGYSNTEGSRDIFIGVQSGQANLTGLYNVFIGYQSGCFNTEGSRNVLLGNAAGFHNTIGQSNIMIGDGAGWSNLDGNNNTFLGSNTGANNTSGSGNVFLGVESGYNNIGGYSNTFIGKSSGFSNTEGISNVYIGDHSGSRNETGENNVLLGTYAGGNQSTGSTNVMIGFNAGYNNGGNNNVFIGSNSGAYEAGSNLLYIDNTSTTSPLIYGDFANNYLVINGNSSSNVNSRSFFVNGSAGGTGPWWNDSDERLKKNITTIPNALDKVLKLRGVNFEWKDINNPEKGTRMGFIAQEAEKIIPEVVSNVGNYSMQYAPITAILVEAIKEQQKLIEKQKDDYESLKAELEAIKAMLKK